MNTPVRYSQIPTVEDSLDMSCDYTEVGNVIPSESQTTHLNNNNVITMDKISELLDQKLNTTLQAHMNNLRLTLREDIKTLVRAEMDAAIQNLKDEFSSTTDFICAEQENLKKEVDIKTKLISSLETENSRLRNDVQKINNRICMLEKSSRNHNVEIQAVPESRNENVMDLFKRLCEIINVPLDPIQIHACRRVAKLNPSSARPRNILVTLSSPYIRDTILSAVHRYNKSHPKETLNSSLIGVTGESRKIYVTEHLSPECKMIHASARKVSKEKQYRYVWVKYGNVYMRKNESSSAILIKNEECLKNLK
ncbi:uncharacterized protein LOC126779040 [Nymphalis io]|uniref:uncharacterized protein LOC126779040 n=1 Tax=Inachis io TaxID=171585 RepID=UPI00216A79BA|nr:uncharacterized protein LOC126779040 [Nymphalis io]